jgi:hypothetical protein
VEGEARWSACEDTDGGVRTIGWRTSCQGSAGVEGKAMCRAVGGRKHWTPTPKRREATLGDKDRDRGSREGNRLGGKEVLVSTNGRRGHSEMEKCLDVSQDETEGK